MLPERRLHAARLSNGIGISHWALARTHSFRLLEALGAALV
jgi:hypothetical protein